jgi:hypothetical protein
LFSPPFLFLFSLFSLLIILSTRDYYEGDLLPTMFVDVAKDDTTLHTLMEVYCKIVVIGYQEEAFLKW